MSTVSYLCQNCGVTVTRQRGDGGAMKYCSTKCSRAKQPRKSREERFWAKVQKGDGCWIWTGAHKHEANSRYGILKSGSPGPGHIELAHRVSWELHNGPIPAGLAVLHHCDNPPCVRPDHLFIGTWADNARDRDTKGRQPIRRGEAHHKAVMTEAMVREARRRYAAGERLTRMAAEFGVSAAHLSEVVRGKSWRHVA